MPIIIANTESLSANWKEAFTELDHYTRLPRVFTFETPPVVFLDQTGFAEPDYTSWLAKLVTAQAKVIVLTATPNNSDAISAIQHGARGYGHSLASPKRLREMYLVVNNNGLWLGKALLNTVLQAIDASPADVSKAPKFPVTNSKKQKYDLTSLSDKELEVAKHVAQGATNAEIAQLLQVTERTVKAHISATFLKLKVRNRVELALYLHRTKTP